MADLLTQSEVLQTNAVLVKWTANHVEDFGSTLLTLLFQSLADINDTQKMNLSRLEIQLSDRKHGEDQEHLTVQSTSVEQEAVHCSSEQSPKERSQEDEGKTRKQSAQSKRAKKQTAQTVQAASPDIANPSKEVLPNSKNRHGTETRALTLSTSKGA